MRVALLSTKRTPRGDHLLAAFAAGVAAHGDEPVFVRDRQDLARLAAADVGVQVCYPNRHHDGSPLAVFRLAATEALEAAGKRIITIDTGFLHSQSDAQLTGGFDPDDPKTYAGADGRIYYSVGYDGLKRHADYCTKASPPDRWEALRVPHRKWRPDGRHYVLVGQPLHGLSTQHVDIYDWYADVFRAVRRAGRPVVYRPHPRLAAFKKTAGKLRADLTKVARAVRAAGAVAYRTSQNRLLRDDLAGAWAAVVFTSNAAVESVCRGIPVVACDPGCLAWDVAGQGLEALQRPPTPDRTKWFNDLGYSQWTVPEMAAGFPWKHLRPHAIGRPL